MASFGASLSLASTNITGRDITIDNRQHITDFQKASKRTIQDYIALGALYNSAGRYESPRCYPETRTAVLQTINQWARANDVSQPIMWLRGAAGAGKSAIAQTLAELWDKDKLLAAAFFFSRTVPQCNEKTYLITTLAYQLSLSVPATRPYVQEAVSRDFSIFTKTLETQMAELVVGPLKAACRTRRQKRTPMIIIVDGLDECSLKVGAQDHGAQHREILDAICYASQQELPLRFLIASRPEWQIRVSFGKDPLSQLKSDIDLSNAAHSDDDIRHFLDAKFKEIRETHDIPDSPWPSNDDISRLVQISSSHFIYPSVAIQYISRPRSNPRQNLKSVLDLEARMKLSENPFSELDELYSLVMRAVRPASLSVVKDIFSNMCWEARITSEEQIATKMNFSLWQLFADSSGPTPTFFERFYLLPPGDLNMHLTDLHSILHIPSSIDSSDQIRFMHASFSEFLTDPSRSGDFYLGREECFLRRQLQLIKHMLIYSSGGATPALTYRQFDLSVLLAMTFLDDMPPSPELREGLKCLLNNDYFPYLKDVGTEYWEIQRGHDMPGRTQWGPQALIHEHSYLGNAIRLFLEVRNQIF